jgi:hypothetical protein
VPQLPCEQWQAFGPPLMEPHAGVLPEQALQERPVPPHAGSLVPATQVLAEQQPPLQPVVSDVSHVVPQRCVDVLQA